MDPDKFLEIAIAEDGFTNTPEFKGALNSPYIPDSLKTTLKGLVGKDFDGRLEYIKQNKEKEPLKEALTTHFTQIRESSRKKIEEDAVKQDRIAATRKAPGTPQETRARAEEAGVGVPKVVQDIFPRFTKREVMRRESEGLGVKPPYGLGGLGGFAGDVGATAADMLTFPGRLAGSFTNWALGGDEAGESKPTAMYESEPLGLGQAIARDPSVPLGGILTGTIKRAAGAMATKMPSWLASGLAGAGAGGVGAGASLASRSLGLDDERPASDIALELGTGVLAGGIMSGAGRAVADKLATRRLMSAGASQGTASRLARQPEYLETTTPESFNRAVEARRIGRAYRPNLAREDGDGLVSFGFDNAPAFTRQSTDDAIRAQNMLYTLQGNAEKYIDHEYMYGAIKTSEAAEGAKGIIRRAIKASDVDTFGSNIPDDWPMIRAIQDVSGAGGPFSQDASRAMANTATQLNKRGYLGFIPEIPEESYLAAIPTKSTAERMLPRALGAIPEAMSGPGAYYAASEAGKSPLAGALISRILSDFREEEEPVSFPDPR